MFKQSVFYTLFIFALALPVTGFAQYDSDASTVVYETNQHRQQHGLAKLTYSNTLSRAAEEHSNYMANRGTISHDGFSERSRLIRRKLKYVTMTGENVAMNWGVKNPDLTAMEGWKNSPGHNENMLNRNFKLIGVGVAKDKKGAYYFTQIFAK